MGKRIDETGNRYGRWTVLYYAGTNKYHKAMWHCKCDCGNEKDVAGLMLRKGISKSCGCINKDRMASINNDKMTHQVNIGDRFGHLTVVDIDSHNKVLCKCDCGQYKKTTRSYLYTGRTTTCGCKMGYKSSTYINEIGNKYGLLTVIEEAGRNSQGRTLWKCQCDCGNTTITTGKNLRRGYTSSCGCLVSKGEQKIKQVLAAEKISFETQKTFEDLRSDKGNLLLFDFYLPEYNVLIECQGQQHSEVVEHFGGISEFQIRQKRDNLKREYCKDHNIKLIEIPYTDYEKIDWDYLKERCSL